MSCIFLHAACLPSCRASFESWGDSPETPAAALRTVWRAEGLGRVMGSSFQPPKGHPCGRLRSTPRRGCPAGDVLLLCLPAHVLICLSILGFSETGRPAALQPCHRGADDDHRVSGARPQALLQLGTLRHVGAIFLYVALDPGMEFSPTVHPSFPSSVHFLQSVFGFDFCCFLFCLFVCLAEEGQHSSLVWCLNEKSHIFYFLPQ